jgi:hypothetical protein
LGRFVPWVLLSLGCFVMSRFELGPFRDTPFSICTEQNTAIIFQVKYKQHPTVGKLCVFIPLQIWAQTTVIYVKQLIKYTPWNVACLNIKNAGDPVRWQFGKSYNQLEIAVS